jgi:SAM-dependent methyltransferase
MTGVDLSERMIALAREEERREPLGIDYVRTSYTDLGAFDDASFDAVVAFMSMMDGPRFDLAMREALRVLRPGGFLAFSITHPCFITKGSRWIRDAQGVKIEWVVSRPGGWSSGASPTRPRTPSRSAHPASTAPYRSTSTRSSAPALSSSGSRSLGRRRNTAGRIRASAAGATTPGLSLLSRDEAARGPGLTAAPARGGA